MVSRSPRRALPFGATLESRGDSVSTIDLNSSAADPPRVRAGRGPPSSTYRSLPSAYTSVAVVIGAPVSCSGAANSGVSGPSADAGHGRDIRVRVGVNELGDAEIEQLDLTVGSHEHIGRLDVAMHDQVGVRVGDGLEHIEEQAHAGLEPERVMIAVGVDVLALDVLQHQVGLLHRRHTGVDEVRDMRMSEPGQDAALAREPRFRVAAHQTQVQQLDRDLPVEPAIAPLSQPDGSHAAAADR